MKKLTVVKFISLLLLSGCMTGTFAETPDVTTTQTPTSQPAATNPDADIVASVQTKISQDPSLLGANISVSSQQGLVTLSGTVSNASQVVTAISDAKTIAGVKDIKLDLTVQASDSSGITHF